MPKETIRPSGDSPDAEGFVLSVGWSRDAGDVQVGVGTPEGPAGRHHLVDRIYGSETEEVGRILLGRLSEAGLLLPLDHRDSTSEAEHRREVGRMALDAVTGSTPFGSDVWWHPTRHDVNRLIVLLRRARDAAFGRDE